MSYFQFEPMKISYLYILSFLFVNALFISCSKQPTLQTFMVEHLEQNDIYNIDLSTDIVSLQEDFQTPENQEILQSIDKITLMAFKKNETTQEKYQSELAQLREILKNKKYDELMRVGKGSQGVKVCSIGGEMSLDEVVVLANDHEQGWLIVRILGDNMNPEKILNLIQKTDINKGKLPFNDLERFFGKETTDISEGEYTKAEN